MTMPPIEMNDNTDTPAISAEGRVPNGTPAS